MKRIFAFLYSIICFCIIGCNQQTTTDNIDPTTINYIASTEISDADVPAEALKRLDSCGIEFVEQSEFVGNKYVPSITREQAHSYKYASFEELCAGFGVKYLKKYGNTYYSMVKISQEAENNKIEWLYYKLSFNENLEYLGSQLYGDCSATISMLDQLSVDMSQQDVIAFLGGGSESSANGFPDDSTFHLIKEKEKWYLCQVDFENGKFQGYFIESL